jgi:hypothetical protein
MAKEHFIQKDNIQPIAIVKGRNAGTSGIADITIIFVAIPAIFIGLDRLININNMNIFLIFITIIIIFSSYGLYYGHYTKEIQFYKTVIVGPFFRSYDLFLHPFKINFQFKYDDIDKIELRRDKNKNYVNFHIKDWRYQIGLADGESQKLHEIINTIRPNLQIEKNN